APHFAVNTDCSWDPSAFLVRPNNRATGLLGEQVPAPEAQWRSNSSGWQIAACLLFQNKTHKFLSPILDIPKVMSSSKIENSYIAILAGPPGDQTEPGC